MLRTPGSGVTIILILLMRIPGLSEMQGPAQVGEWARLSFRPSDPTYGVCWLGEGTMTNALSPQGPIRLALAIFKQFFSNGDFQIIKVVCPDYFKH